MDHGTQADTPSETCATSRSTVFAIQHWRRCHPCSNLSCAMNGLRGQLNVLAYPMIP